jgi:predicted branched-subunit amino acid permease
MFICLLVLQFRGIHHVLVALFSGVIAVILSLMIPGNSYILIAAFLASSAGLLLRKTKWRKNEREGNV